MKSERLQKSTEILFDLVVTVEPRLRTLSAWYFDLVETIDTWFTSEGNQGTKRAKDILGQGWLSILGEEVSVLDFVKSTDGIPDLVRPLVDRVKHLKKDARLMSAVLSIVRVTDLWEGQLQDSTVEDALSVINDHKLPSTAQKIMHEFETFVPLFQSTHPTHPLSRAKGKTIKVGSSTATQVTMYSESAGPNGPLVMNAHKDVLSLDESICANGKSLLDNVIDLGNKVQPMGWKINTSFPDAILSEENRVPHSEAPGKLAALPDKSGKVRVIAEPDWFSQFTMKPLHDHLMEILRNTPEDATYDQRSALPRISAWENRGAYLASFDQSNCTDRFPFDIQLMVLSCLTTTDLAEAARIVMSDRDWVIRLPSGRLRKVRWSVGQPLGMYASWPLMALTHHYLVQYAHWRSVGRSTRWRPFSDYCICGDDIVIADKRVADSYRKVAEALGMKINMAKSHISGRGTPVDPVAEFTKVIVWRGQPLFPIKPRMVFASVKDWRKAVPLLIDLASREGYAVKLKTLTRVVKKHYCRSSRFLLPMLTIPREFGGVGFRDAEPMKKRFTSLDTREIEPMLYYLATKVRRSLLEQALVFSQSLETCPDSAVRYHPLMEYARQWSPPKRRYLENSSVPTVAEIAKMLMIEGIQVFQDEVLGTSRFPQPPWSKKAEKDQLLNRSAWEAALSKKHYFPPDLWTDMQLLRFIAEDTDELGVRLNTETVLASVQYSTVSRLLLEGVSNRRT